ncbi:MAG TPA: DUF4260 domain-containing protein [Candidatus Saccharimonadales bacterium]
MSRPTVAWLRAEGLIILLASLFVYAELGGHWLWFGALIFSFDASMVGYLKNDRLGALTYNIGHSLILPLILAAASWQLNEDLWLKFSVIWLAHIGLDRSLGYGLKSFDGFKYTHLGTISQSDRSK